MLLTRAALGGIWVYQQYISPYKGFRCAHAVLHGGSGCSGFAKDAIRSAGFWAAIPQIKARFSDCKSAYQEIIAAREADDNENDADKKELEQRKKKRSDRCDRWVLPCDFASAFTAPLPCGRASKTAGSGSILDINPCDGDGCGIDCGSVDVCSCT